MPKVVDHQARRRQLSEALWRVVSRDGVEAVSVRNVAAEAGCSPGALRHYFPEQSDLVASALALVSDRFAARIAALDIPGPPVEVIQAYCEQMIPLDEERRIEAEVWFGFVTRARHDPSLDALTRRVHQDLRAFLAQLLPYINAAPTEVDRLHALIDGFTVHLLLYPDHLSPDTVRAELRTHLRSIANP
ncbi:TetR/AcrR family transcriptional regulator [Actinocorallia sp. A-T 12471]|uniref:TetR/AcrR family transcriptional regulator n=1 Tax=Actinocorallia sp. A-T 12471 TaxID=3089813 RepID=UPI0029CDA444|nr:TetR/AcrR family transcriptional regulator [Actinocorallia sp. A-T 12471]MDX6744936.1 TetR/AcrR family transcriptional regulator [Actinocorallia sp. A-T 12471]